MAALPLAAISGSVLFFARKILPIKYIGMHFAAIPPPHFPFDGTVSSLPMGSSSASRRVKLQCPFAMSSAFTIFRPSANPRTPHNCEMAVATPSHSFLFYFVCCCCRSLQMVNVTIDFASVALNG